MELSPDSKSKTWASACLEVLRSHSLFLVLCVIYVLCGNYYVETFGGQTGRISYTSYFVLRMAIPILVIAFGLFVVWQAITVRPDRLLFHCWSRVREEFLTKERILQAIPVLVIMPIVFATFTNIKVIIPVVNPFSWDVYFAELDRAIHGGVQPWEWLQPIIGFPIATRLIHICYILWLALLYVVLFWQSFSHADQFLRMRFLITFVLSWALIGSIGGTLFSSAGPVYFERVVGQSGDFGPLNQYLKQVFTDTETGLIFVQERLWNTYASGQADRLSGISAMPSMHVAIVTVMALLGWGYSRTLGLVLSAFAVMILIGSVHLAWHYAVDGYVSIAAALLIWCFVGVILRRMAGILGIPHAKANPRSAAVAVA